jgi:hypothetical protein
MDQFSNQNVTPPPYNPASIKNDTIDDAKKSIAFLKQSNVANAEIYNILIKRGLDHQTVIDLIEATPAAIEKKPDRRQEGINNMIIGALLVVAGIFFSVLSYDAVSETGGRYFVLYGPVVAGIVLFFSGVSKL